MIPTIIRLSTTSEYNNNNNNDNDNDNNHSHFANTSTTTVASGSLLHTTLLAMIMVLAIVVSSVMCVPVRSYSFVSSTLGRRRRRGPPPLFTRSGRYSSGTTRLYADRIPSNDLLQQQQEETSRGRLLVLGGTGYLGQVVCEKAVRAGYSVVTLSRRGLPPSSSSSSTVTKDWWKNVEYRKGDARQPESIASILDEGNICGVVHCIGLLFDDASGLGAYNQYVSGSRSLPDSDSTYDTITRRTAFHAIDATIAYGNKMNPTTTAATTTTTTTAIPFCFTSAAEAGWPEVTGGNLIERLMPDFIHRYMVAKRAVEAKLLASQPMLRPIIVRPSLIYSWDKLASLPAVGTFTFLNQIGVPFVDRPVTVDALASAIVRAIGDESIVGIQRYPQIDRLSE
jgi:NAD(P)-dependent dehydrogenase (short-subunit alcohol dehydrogenase family)